MRTIYIIINQLYLLKKDNNIHKLRRKRYTFSYLHRSMSDHCCNNVKIHKTCSHIDQHFRENRAYFPGEIQLEIANESDLRSLRGRALVTLFRSSVSSGRNSVTVTVVRTAVRSQVHTRSASGRVHSGRSFMYGGFFPDDKIAASVRSRGLCGPRSYIHRGTHADCH